MSLLIFIFLHLSAFLSSHLHLSSHVSLSSSLSLFTSLSLSLSSSSSLFTCQSLSFSSGSLFTCPLSLSFFHLSSLFSMHCMLSVVECVVCCCGCSCGCSCGGGCECGCVYVCAFLLVLHSKHFKTLPCVRSRRSRVYFQNARHIGYGRFEGTHGSVFERSHGNSRSLALHLSLSSRVSLSLSLFTHVALSSKTSLSLFLSLSLSLCSSLFLSLFSLNNSLNNNDTDRSSSWLSLYTTLTCPECQSAWALAHSLSGEHVRIMQETIV